VANRSRLATGSVGRLGSRHPSKAKSAVPFPEAEGVDRLVRGQSSAESAEPRSSHGPEQAGRSATERRPADFTERRNLGAPVASRRRDQIRLLDLVPCSEVASARNLRRPLSRTLEQALQPQPMERNSDRRTRP
jgi:hypothetical protein